MAPGAKLLVAALTIASVAGASYAQILQVRASRPRVWTEVVRRRDVQATITAAGQARSARGLVLSASDDGHVRSVLVRPGQIVRAGQRLLSLDEQPGRLDLDRARSHVAAALADVSHAQADADRLRAGHHCARLSLRRTEALAAAAERGDLGSMHRLLSVLAQPYDSLPHDSEYRLPSGSDSYRTFCGT